MISKTDIEKITEAYRNNEIKKASHLGKIFYNDLPKSIKKVVEVSNFLVGNEPFGNIEELIDYSSHFDIILAKRYFLEGNFKKYFNTILKTIENSKDTLTKLYGLKELNISNQKKFDEIYPKYSSLEAQTVRSEYLKKFLSSNYTEAIKISSEFTSQNNHAEIILDIADIWYHTGQYYELANLCFSLQKEGRLSNYFSYLYAFSFFSSGKIYDATAILEKLLQIYPKNVNILYNLANCYIQLGKLRESEKLLLEAEKLFKSPSINFTKGVLYYKLGEYNTAKEEFTKSLGSNEFEFSSKYNIAICECNLGMYDSAIKRLIEIRNSSYVDRKNFERLDRTIDIVRRIGRKIPSWLIILIILLISSGISIGTYFVLSLIKFLR
jgi:tetratricopeptide (TPR) repeat protein